MTQEQITEGNRLIAEFMGWRFNGTEFTAPPEFEVIIPFISQPRRATSLHCFKTTLFKIEELRFNVSWDALMPVIQKIGTIDEFLPEPLSNVTLYSTIEEVYKEVVSSIKWYNQTKQP